MQLQFPRVHRLAPVSAVRALGLDVRPGGHVEVDEAWVETPHPAAPDWTVALRLATNAAGHLCLVELRIFPHEEWRGRPAGAWSAEFKPIDSDGIPGKGLTADLVSRLPIGALRDQTFQLLEAFQTRPRDRRQHDAHAALVTRMSPHELVPEPSGPEEFFAATVPFDFRPDARRGRRRPGPPGRPAWFCAQLSAEYIELKKRGSRKARADLEARYPNDNARECIRRAHDKFGLLDDKLEALTSLAHKCIEDAKKRGYLTAAGKITARGRKIVQKALQPKKPKARRHRSRSRGRAKR